MISASLKWVTPEAEFLLGNIARVSNPGNENNPEVGRLISYMLRNKHWSPFEMVNICLEVNAPRDITRQLLRHSFKFQEFSQRYADPTEYPGFCDRECRLQDTLNRQKSIDLDMSNENHQAISIAWNEISRGSMRNAKELYKEALRMGIAKEVARTILPEGQTMSRLYVNGTLRNWIHYILVRKESGTQKEHRQLAEKCEEIVEKCFPTTWSFIKQGVLGND